VHRLFKCQFLTRLPTTLESHLNSHASTSVDDLYFGVLLNLKADTYGLKPSTSFAKHLAAATKSSVMSSFNKNNWAYHTNNESVNAISTQSLRAAIIMSVSKDSEV